MKKLVKVVFEEAEFPDYVIVKSVSEDFIDEVVKPIASALKTFTPYESEIPEYNRRQFYGFSTIIKQNFIYSGDYPGNSTIEALGGKSATEYYKDMLSPEIIKCFVNTFLLNVRRSSENYYLNIIGIKSIEIINIEEKLF